MGRHVHDAERLLTPADVEDLLLRVAAEQTVSPLSMDAAYDPPPLLKLRERAAATGAGCAVTHTTVLLRAMCASDEPSLEPHQSIQWTAHAVVRVLARLARAHPSPEVFEPVIAGMHAVQAEHPRGGVWYPMRFALGWLLLAELRREPGEGATRVSRWAKRLASSAARDAAGEKTNESVEKRGDRKDAFAFSRELFGGFRVARDVAAFERAHFLGGGEWCVRTCATDE
jgi:hypothetical protein